MPIVCFSDFVFFSSYVVMPQTTIRLLLVIQYLRRLNKQGGSFSKMDQWNCRTSANVEQRALWGQVQKDKLLGERKRYFTRSEEDREAMAKIQLVVLFCAVALAFASPTGEHDAATCTCMSHVYIHARGGKMAAVDKTMQHSWFYARKGCTTCMQHACKF